MISEDTATECGVTTLGSRDHINGTALYLYPTANPAATYSFMDEFDKLISVLGPPLSTNTEFAEMFNAEVTTYKFKDFETLYAEGSSFGEQFHGPAVSLGIVDKGEHQSRR